MIDILTNRYSNNPSKVIGSVYKADYINESFKNKFNHHNKSMVLAGTSLIGNKEIDISWLEAAADSYKISADPKDYIIVDIPIVTVDIPNRNMQGFPYEEVSYFDPLYGKMIYSTFIGKPTHMDHDNKDPLKAKGIHFDASMQYVPKYNVWKIRVLAGFDRTKDRDLCNDILKGKRNGYSMGAAVSSFVCSNCGATETNVAACNCMKKHGKGAVMPNNHLVWQVCVGVNFIETSSVTDPADVSAETDNLWD